MGSRVVSSLFNFIPLEEGVRSSSRRPENGEDASTSERGDLARSGFIGAPLDKVPLAINLRALFAARGYVTARRCDPGFGYYSRTNKIFIHPAGTRTRRRRR